MLTLWRAVFGLAFGQTTIDPYPAAKFALPVDAQPGIFLILQPPAVVFQPGIAFLGK